MRKQSEWKIIILNSKVKYHKCVPYNVPNSVISLLPPEIRICSGEEQLNETEAKDLETVCLEECLQRSFSTSVMSSSMFDDPGDFFYSRLLRRPRPNSPGDSPRFWAEYVQYVKSLGSATVLGPPRCHNCFQIVFRIVFLRVPCFPPGEAHSGLHVLRTLWVIKLTSGILALYSFQSNIQINE